MDYRTNAEVFADLKGRTLVRIERDYAGDEKLTFTTDDGKEFLMYHEQDCCETVLIESIVGDLDDLLNTPITMAEVAANNSENGDMSQTWTFYKLATIKGYVDIRWFGTSNGYYSESVSFVEVK